MILLTAPRLAEMMVLSSDHTEAELPLVYLVPRTETILTRKSWLRHEVSVDAAKSERIAISFDYA